MMIYKADLEATHFLNVDLDIQSTANLEPLVSALGDKITVLHVGRVKRTYHARLEVEQLTRDADSTIRVFCSLIGSLPKAGRTLWNTAKIRDFNIGIQAGIRPYAHEIALAADTLKAASKVGARIVVTIYAPEKPTKRSPAGKRTSEAARSGQPSI